MNFLKAQAKGFLVGTFVAVLWAALDWFGSKHGLPVQATRSYSDVLFGATAGAGVVFMMWSSKAQTIG